MLYTFEHEHIIGISIEHRYRDEFTQLKILINHVCQHGLPHLVRQDEGSFGDHQWFSSAGHVQGVSSGRDTVFAPSKLEDIIN
ncbi:hypothetical protein MTR67_008352 [Solanum verrucosum]|uniref:Uncharacterized protein n=1 Tax=Solanum verrucosum TaxID=315347 RepID=A0AAF0Q1E6_SOLVR|nr:hypothetical protein MTR67_008352 [Solanum verrucosum]